MKAHIFQFDERSKMPLAKLQAAGFVTIVIPSTDDVARYSPVTEPLDDFLTEDEKGLPIVRKPVGRME